MTTIEAARKELETYAELKQGWDSDKAMEPNLKQIEIALGFLRGLPKDFAAPTPMLGSNGMVGFYWHERPYYFDAEIEPGGRVSILISVSASTIHTNVRKEKWWPTVSVEEAVAIYTAHMEYWLMDLNGVVGLMP